MAVVARSASQRLRGEIALVPSRSAGVGIGPYAEALPFGVARQALVRLTVTIGREILIDEEASPNYRMRAVRLRRTGAVSWEVVEAAGGKLVASGLSTREEALRLIRGWERLSQRIEGGLPDHLLVH